MKHNVIYANVTHEKGAIKILPQCGRRGGKKTFHSVSSAAVDRWNFGIFRSNRSVVCF